MDQKMEVATENNKVTVMGEVLEPFSLSHEVYGEGFYMTRLRVPRLSDSADIIPVMVSDRLVDVASDLTGRKVMVAGQYRSYNRHEDNRNRLMLSIFVREWEFIEEIERSERANCIELTGFICKEPIYRKTPLGREIADLLVAVNRPYGKSDYIPCISWGRNARFAKDLPIGSRCHIVGRIQSREYTKKLSETEVQKRVAYEVSVSKVELALEDTIEVVEEVAAE